MRNAAWKKVSSGTLPGRCLSAPCVVKNPGFPVGSLMPATSTAAIQGEVRGLNQSQGVEKWKSEIQESSWRAWQDCRSGVSWRPLVDWIGCCLRNARSTVREILRQNPKDWTTTARITIAGLGGWNYVFRLFSAVDTGGQKSWQWSETLLEWLKYRDL